MKTFKLLLVGALVAGSFFGGTPAKATCALSNRALQICYDECNKIYDPILARACQLGCYIGCVWAESQ